MGTVATQPPGQRRQADAMPSRSTSEARITTAAGMQCPAVAPVRAAQRLGVCITCQIGTNSAITRT
jgi:hypothetical protein